MLFLQLLLVLQGHGVSPGKAAGPGASAAPGRTGARAGPGLPGRGSEGLNRVLVVVLSVLVLVLVVLVLVLLWRRLLLVLDRHVRVRIVRLRRGHHHNGPARRGPCRRTSHLAHSCCCTAAPPAATGGGRAEGGASRQGVCARTGPSGRRRLALAAGYSRDSARWGGRHRIVVGREGGYKSWGRRRRRCNSDWRGTLSVLTPGRGSGAAAMSGALVVAPGGKPRLSDAVHIGEDDGLSTLP